MPDISPVSPAPTDLKNLSLTQLQAWLADLGVEGYRARQVARWVFKAGVAQVSDMTDVPKTLRQALEPRARITQLPGLAVHQASDGTRKLRYQLDDGAVIESVLIREPTRLTLCLSTQAGCRIGCAFCLTTKGGLRRHLRPAEIIDQIIQARKRLGPGERLTNLVFMGMGEPLDRGWCPPSENSGPRGCGSTSPCRSTPPTTPFAPGSCPLTNAGRSASCWRHAESTRCPPVGASPSNTCC
jgi:23S rRNA (adenine2503-C2)-methyltransferase